MANCPVLLPPFWPAFPPHDLHLGLQDLRLSSPVSGKSRAVTYRAHSTSSGSLARPRLAAQPSASEHAFSTTFDPPVSRQIPLSSPPPPVQSATFSPSPSPIPRSTPTRLIRPDSRIHRQARKKRLLVPSLKPLARYDPEHNGLWPIVESEEEYNIDPTGELVSRSTVTSPLSSTASSRSVTPIRQLLSARPSSQLLAPSPSSSPTSGLDSPLYQSYLPVEVAHTMLPPKTTCGLSDPFIMDEQSAEELRQPRRVRSTRRPPPLSLASSAKVESARHPYTRTAAQQSSPARPRQAAPAWRLPYRNVPPAQRILAPRPVVSAGVRKARSRPSPARSTFAKPRQSWSERLTDSRYDEPSSSSAMDLEATMEELLAAAGERTTPILRQPFADSAFGPELAAAFPLPPHRSTPFGLASPPRPPRLDDMGMDVFAPYHDGDRLASPIELYEPSVASPCRCCTPSPPPQAPKRDRSWSPALIGDHSRLQMLSRGEDIPQAVETFPGHSSGELGSPISQHSSLASDVSSTATRSSARSTRSLPRRAGLPDRWLVDGVLRV